MKCGKISSTKIISLFELSSVPDGYIEFSLESRNGDLLKYLNSDYTRKTLQECFDEGLLVEVKEADEIFAWWGGKWQAVKDYTTTDYWYKETAEKVVFQYNDVPDETMTKFIPLEGDYVVWNGSDWEYDFSPYKLGKQAEVTVIRDIRILTGFTYNTKQISCDLISQANANAFLTSEIAGVLTYPVKWRTADNSIIDIVDSNELKLFTGTMMGFVQTVFQESWTVKDVIELATQIEDIDSAFEGYVNG